MKDFNKIKYKRINFKETQLNLNTLIKQLKETYDFNVYISIVRKINDIQNHLKEINTGHINLDNGGYFYKTITYLFRTILLY